MRDICINTLINDMETGAQYVVLWIAPDDGIGYWYDLTSQSQKPACFSTNDIASGRAEGRFEISAFNPPVATRPEDTLSNKERENRDNAWTIIQPVV